MTINISKSDQELFDNSYNSEGFTVDSESFYESLDLICEGPIEGLSDSNGSTLNYIDLNSDENVENSSSLAYGVYYNDVSIKDRKSNLFNISSSEFSISLGNEKPIFPSYCSSLYEYKTKIYDLNSSLPEFSKVDGDKITPNLILTSFNESTTDATQLSIINLKERARIFSHYVKNKYATNFKVIISLDELYYISDTGQNYNNTVRFVISLTNSFQQKTQYLFVQAYIIAKQNPVLLTFDLTIDKTDKLNNINSEFFINVYSVQQRIPASGPKKGVLARSFSVNSVVEIVDYQFLYPFSAICKNKVSAKHFSSIPVRSFDCKLLKINVPENYDAEAKEYLGDWNGNFNKSLRWSDNPAWIFNDLCTNSRYGLAKSVLDQSDLNKWELYKISKYCDELVQTNCSTKYSFQSFTYDNNLKENEDNYNCIQISTSEDLISLRNKYPFGGLLFIYDLQDENGEIVDKNVKKIIGPITTNGSIATIRLYNDFGPRKFIESDNSGNFFSALQKYILNNPGLLNTQDKVKTFAVSYISGTNNTVLGYNSASEQVSLQYSKSKIFDSSLKIKTGKCVARHEGFDDFLEPRFSANIIINDQTEALKILTDLASVFRGIFYFRNGFLNLTSDIKKNPLYVFNNSNVKDGLFTYSSNNLNNSFSIAKISYLDKNDNFKDKIVYVEDSKLIEKYGIIENEILGFGSTSKYQAQRIGKWFLATGKLESEIVSFSGGLEISMLKIGDIVRISDALKNSNIEYGRIVSIDIKNNFIYVDREISQNALGKIIKIFSLINNELHELTYFISEVDNVNLKLKLDIKAYLSWNVVSKVIVSEDNRTISGDNSGGSVWSRKAFTKQSYIDNCQISFNVVYPATFLVCGLSEVSNITNNQNDINYGLGIAGGSLYVIENGTTHSVTAPTITETDLLSVTYDGVYVRYYLNSTKLREVSRPKGNPLYGVAAFNTQYASINNINFSPFPDYDYGSFSFLRSDASFTIYLKDYSNDGDLYRIVSISENSPNEYSLSAMKYSYEKFDFVEKDEYIDTKQYLQKEIVFATDNYIYSAYTDSEIESLFVSGYISEKSINYLTSLNTFYDYSFSIDNESLVLGISENKYIQLKIDFVKLFLFSKVASNLNVYGLCCIINKNGKTIKFRIERDNAKEVNIFLGEVEINSTFYSPKYSIDFYAFDKNMKLINV